MNYSINQATLMKTPMEDFLRAISNAGFTGVELRRDETFAYLEEHTITELKKLLEELNLEVVSWNAIELFSLCSREDFEGILEYTDRLMKIGNKIGCDLIIAVPSFMSDSIFPSNQIKQKTIERFQELRGLGRKYDFKIGFESLGFPDCSIRKIDDALKILEDSEEDGLPPSGLVIDTFHYYLAHETARELLKISSEKLWLIHCNDAVNKPLNVLKDGDRVMPGEGFFKLNDFFNNLEKMDYNGYLSLELFNEKIWKESPDKIADIAMKSMEKFFPNG